MCHTASPRSDEDGEGQNVYIKVTWSGAHKQLIGKINL